jgi:DNA ligase (NAD+)
MSESKKACSLSSELLTAATRNATLSTSSECLSDVATTAQVDLQMMRLQLRKWNTSYRAGFPEVVDQLYDTTLLALEKNLSHAEFAAFQLELLEVPGDVKHPCIVGSLENVYASNTLKKREIMDWIQKYSIRRIFVSEKVDGISSVTTYRGTTAIGSASRGNGESGEAFPARNVSRIFPTLHEPVEHCVVRAELTLCGEVTQRFGLKNRRNGTVGTLKSTTVDHERLDAVRVLAYQIVGETLTREQQFTRLRELGFQTPKSAIFDVTDQLPTQLCQFLEDCRKTADYDIDGLAVCDIDFIHEERYYPEKMVAFKMLKSGTETTITSIEINVTKGGLLAPVAILEPTLIDGTTVSRASVYHFGNILSRQLGPGARVLVHKSGEIIPEVTEVLVPAEYTLPTHCPDCHGELQFSEGYTRIRCLNTDCGDAKYKRMSYFLNNCGIRGAALTTLRKLSIDSIDALLEFQPDPRLKTQCRLAEQIDQLVINTFTESELLAKMSFSTGGGGKTVQAILAHYGIPQLNLYARDGIPTDLTNFPSSIQLTTLQNFISGGWTRNFLDCQKICQDPRRNNEAIQQRAIQSQMTQMSQLDQPLSGQTFLLTGTLTRKRAEFEADIKAAGGTILGAVSKSLNYLVVGEKAGNKLSRAQAIPTISILSEEQLEKILQESYLSSDGR